MSRSTTVLRRAAAACALGTTPVAVVAHAPSPASADDEIYYCITESLPVEEVQQGATVEPECDWIDPEELGLRSLTNLVGTHYDTTSGTGAILDVEGVCDSSTAFGSTDFWNNRIGSSRQRTCGAIKHFDNANLTGDSETHDGATNTLEALTGMDNRTTSIGYD